MFCIALNRLLRHFIVSLLFKADFVYCVCGHQLRDFTCNLKKIVKDWLNLQMMF